MRRRAACVSSRARGASPPVSGAAVEPHAPVTRAVKVAAGTAHVQTVLDQQGTGRVTHQPDGSIVWEPIGIAGSDASSNARGKRPLPEAVLRRILGLAELAGACSLAMGATVAAAATLVHVDRAYKNGTNLTTGQLTGAVANTVASSFAGLSAGLLLGPMRATTQLVRASIKPIAAGLLVHRGVRFVRARFIGVPGLLRGLESGSLPQRLRALAGIVARALASEQFRRDFASCSGFTLLLRLLEDCLAEAQAGSAAGPGVLPPMLPPTVHALEGLLRSPVAVDACVAHGGVPLLLQLLPPPADATQRSEGGASPTLRSSGSSTSGSMLVHSPGSSGGAAAGVCTSDPELCASALTCLSHVSGTTHGRAAIRCAGGIPVVASALLRAVPGSIQARPAVATLSALAGDDEGKAALGDAAPMAALLVATGHEATCDAAIGALLSCVRGNAASQVLLSKQHGASAALRTCAAARGSGAATAAADVASLLNILASFPADAPCNWPAPAGSPLSKAATEEYEMVSHV
mmetsp:Transcript_37285/g.80265  ORF Transcript_37285/g.80265 Transcript_37285/m.80265 type:complete len:521 (+) Transcript_37285:77-1639(+)